MSKIFQNKNILQKIAIVVLITLLVYFSIPTFSFAAWGGDMLKVLTQLLAAIGDTVMGALNHFMLGTDKMIGSVMLSRHDLTVTDSSGALYAGSEQVDIELDQNNDEEKIDGGLWDTDDEWQVPNLLYSPEAIFSNSIAALDVNFLRPNEYTSVQDTTEAEQHSESAAAQLQETIGSWYVAFRNIAIVALLTVLVYIGIRILISSTSADKAKYKEALRDWLVAMCLVFVIHFVMSAVLMIIDQITILFGNSATGMVVDVDGTKMKLSLMGVSRLRVQSTNAGISATFCIIYLVLVVYTIMFTFTYLKRFLYMAFLTMIAPLVAITYPLDKLGDGKAQAFNYWFKEYLMNAILQPLHLILYTTLIVSALELVQENFIYALVAIGFLIPAEKFVKQMFGFNKADSAGTLGGFAAGALTMSGLKKMASAKPHFSNSNQKSGNDKIRTADGNKDLPLTGKSDYKGLDSVKFGDITGRNNGLNKGEGSAPLLGDNSNNQTPENSQQKPKTEGGISNGSDSIIDQQSGIRPNEDSSGNMNIPISNAPIFTDENRDRYGNMQEAPVDGRSQLSPDEQRRKERIDNLKQGFNANIMGSPITKTAIRGAKSVGKTVWKNKGKIAGTIAKTAVSATTGVLGAGIGLAAGIATGDASKAFQYATAGGVAGSAIGKNATNAVGSLGKNGYRAIKDTAGNIANAYREESLGYAEADKIKQEKINKKAMKAFMENEEQLKKAKQTQIKLSKDGHNVDIKDIMKSRYDYIAAGIDDEQQIQRAQIAEAKSGGINGSTHGNYVGIAQAVDELGINASTFSDNKKYNEIHDTISAKLGSEENGVRAMKMMAEIKGAEDANNFQYMKRQAAQKQVVAPEYRKRQVGKRGGERAKKKR